MTKFSFLFWDTLFAPFPKTQQPQAESVVCSVWAFLQPFANPAQGARSDVSSPPFKTPRGPALLFAVTFRHVLRERAHPRDGFYVDGSRPAVAGDRPRQLSPMELQLLTHILVWHRVMVLLIAT